MKKLAPLLILALTVAVAGLAAGPALARKHRTLTVCKHGCRYRKVQSAVNAARTGDTVRVRPGKYVEGVVVRGHRDNLTIIGTGTNPRAVILEGKGAKGPLGAAQNGVEGDSVNHLHLENMWARNFAGNGFFVHGNEGHPCHGYLMRKLIASFNGAYGLYTFNCIGGRMTESTGYGHSDSAFYVGETPPQAHPVWTILDHLTGYENVLGYSGTNSKYIDLRDSEFYNNGAGIVPNTLDSEKYEPTSTGIIEENLSYWNNFNYFKKGSPVKPSGSVGPGGFHYPTGVGVILFGATGWTVKNNFIFGNFKWGAAAFGDPTNTSGKAKDIRNTFRYNTMGAAFDDANGADFFTTGDGYGTCWQDNSAGATFDPGAEPNLLLYPSCPNTSTVDKPGDPAQLADLASYAGQTEGQESSWHKHPHPRRFGRKAIDGF